MASNSTYSVPYRRKREGKTNYKTRMKLLFGSKPRLVVRKSLKHISLQIIEFQPKGDKVLAQSHSRELAPLGWKVSASNSSAAYLTGLLLARKVKKGFECMLDIGQRESVKGSVVYAALKGCIDGGMKVPCSAEILPDMKRIRGEHVAAYALKLKSDKVRFASQFGRYTKLGVDPALLPQIFDKVKGAIDAMKSGAV